MAHDVFLSYAHQDKAVAEQVCEHLEGQGIDCWIAPRNIIEGETFGAAITQAIETCRVVVLLFSTAANSSKQVVRELKLADDAGKTVIPVRLANIKASGDFAYFLGAAHWLDAVGGPAKAHLERLTQAARNYLVSPPEPPAPKLPQSSLTPGTVRTNPIDGQRYVWVPPGTFWMGASPDDTEAFEDEKPRHQVTLTKGFLVGRDRRDARCVPSLRCCKDRWSQKPPTPSFRRLTSTQ